MGHNNKQSLRKDLLKILLLLAREDLRAVYRRSQSKSVLLEDLLYLWKNSYELKSESLELFFTVSEKDALSSIQKAFDEMFYSFFRGENAESLMREESFEKVSKEAKKSLLVFSQKEILLYYKEFLEDFEET